MTIPPTNYAAKLPLEVWQHIASTLHFGSAYSINLCCFMTASKYFQAIGDPILYSSVHLGHIHDLASFCGFARSITNHKAAYVLTISLPDSFVEETAPADASVGQDLLQSLYNLKEMTICPRSSGPTPFWTPAMFKDLPFQLDQLLWGFSNSVLSSAFLATQNLIRGGIINIASNNDQIRNLPPSLDAILVYVYSQKSRHSPMRVGDATLRSRIRKMVIRGNIQVHMYKELTAFCKMRSLSISMAAGDTALHFDVLVDIVRAVPTLDHLTLWTNGAILDLETGNCGGTDQTNQTDPFKSLSQVPPMPNLKSLLIVIRRGKLPKLTVGCAAGAMNRCPQLIQLDVVPTSPTGFLGHAFRRECNGETYRSLYVVNRPCQQDAWF